MTKNNSAGKGDKYQSILTPSFEELRQLAAQAGTFKGDGDTPKNQPSEFSFAGHGAQGEATDRSRQNKEFATLAIVA